MPKPQKRERLSLDIAENTKLRIQRLMEQTEITSITQLIVHATQVLEGLYSYRAKGYLITLIHKDDPKDKWCLDIGI